MSTESDVEALKRAIGELAGAVEDLAEAVKQGPYSDTATMRAAVNVSTTARNVASQFVVQDLIAPEPHLAEFSAVEVPEDVIALARAGKTLEAVKRYRAVSGATLDEAQAGIRDIT